MKITVNGESITKKYCQQTNKA